MRGKGKHPGMPTKIALEEKISYPLGFLENCYAYFFDSGSSNPISGY